MAALTRDERARMVGMRPELADAVPDLKRNTEALTGKRVTLISGVRSLAEQQALYEARTAARPVALPGTSRHEYGAAADFAIDGGTREDYRTLGDVAQRLGFVSGEEFTTPDPGHVQLDESLSESIANSLADPAADLTDGGGSDIAGLVALGAVLVLAMLPERNP